MSTTYDLPVLTQALVTNQCTDILSYFRYDHLPEHLQKVSRPFSTMAYNLMDDLPTNDEKYQALRKLLEAKDCAVRSFLRKHHATNS